MRERITISIKKDLLNKIDQQIDGSRLRNRSHAIEHFVSESLGLADFNNAVILGGGKGALKLVPIIEESIVQLKEYGLGVIYLAVGYLGPKIKEYIGDGTKFGVKIKYIEGGEGTAGALKPLEKEFKKTFLVVNLDESLAVDLKKFSNYHRQHLAVVTIASNNQPEAKGIYLFEPEVFRYIPEGFSMLETDVFPKLIEDSKLASFPLLNQ